MMVPKPALGGPIEMQKEYYSVSAAISYCSEDTLSLNTQH